MTLTIRKGENPLKEAFKTIYSGGVGEYIIKKSKFIANVCPVVTENEAIEFIERLKKKYWDASHNCSAYIIGTDQQLLRCSDDGEPSKTAGKPMLDILVSHGLTNLVIVVTRYFGGTLLGTGGLVKAYQAAVLKGLEQCEIITKELGFQLTICTDYNAIGKLQYLIGQEQITILNSIYTDIVTITLLVLPSKMEFVTKKVAELTNGSATLEVSGQVYFTTMNNEILLF